eukprot:GILJ01006017.1.p1 GENE.GILJ01006017.1~~GILJ01006017.1.p1  ORF type:complete len:725 (+),score=157.78 GILJ01006017.1:80-2254(+)
MSFASRPYVDPNDGSSKSPFSIRRTKSNRSVVQLPLNRSKSVPNVFSNTSRAVATPRVAPSRSSRALTPSTARSSARSLLASPQFGPTLSVTAPAASPSHTRNDSCDSSAMEFRDRLLVLEEAQQRLEKRLESTKGSKQIQQVVQNLNQVEASLKNLTQRTQECERRVFQRDADLRLWIDGIDKRIKKDLDRTVRSHIDSLRTEFRTSISKMQQEDEDRRLWDSSEVKSTMDSLMEFKKDINRSIETVEQKLNRERESMRAWVLTSLQDVVTANRDQRSLYMISANGSELNSTQVSQDNMQLTTSPMLDESTSLVQVRAGLRSGPSEQELLAIKKEMEGLLQTCWELKSSMSQLSDSHHQQMSRFDGRIKEQNRATKEQLTQMESRFDVNRSDVQDQLHDLQSSVLDIRGSIPPNMDTIVEQISEIQRNVGTVLNSKTAASSAVTSSPSPLRRSSSSLNRDSLKDFDISQIAVDRALNLLRGELLTAVYREFNPSPNLHQSLKELILDRDVDRSSASESAVDRQAIRVAVFMLKEAFKVTESVEDFCRKYGDQLDRIELEVREIRGSILLGGRIRSWSADSASDDIPQQHIHTLDSEIKSSFPSELEAEPATVHLNLHADEEDIPNALDAGSPLNWYHMNGSHTTDPSVMSPATEEPIQQQDHDIIESRIEWNQREIPLADDNIDFESDPIQELAQVEVNLPDSALESGVVLSHQPSFDIFETF